MFSSILRWLQLTYYIFQNSEKRGFEMSLTHRNDKLSGDEYFKQHDLIITHSIHVTKFHTYPIHM